MYVNLFFVLRSIPSGTIDINLKKWCFELSQIATVTYCDKTGILTIAIRDLSQFVIKTVIWDIDSYNTENVFCVLGWVPRFTFDMHMKSCIFAHFGVFSMVYLFVCITVIMSISDVSRKPPCTGQMCRWTCFLHLGVYPRVLLTSIREVVFWTVTNFDSHFLRQNSNPCRRNLWFVAICDQSHDGANSVQQHWKRVLGNWESTHVHFRHEYEKLHFCPFWCYFTSVPVCVYVYQL